MGRGWVAGVSLACCPRVRDHRVDRSRIGLNDDREKIVDDLNRARRCNGSAGAICTLVVLLAGCGGHERIVVRNQMNEPVQVQLALPYPSYAFSAGAPCVYDICLGAESEWESKWASSDDASEWLLLQPNGPLVFRLRRVGGKWCEYVLVTDEPLDELDPVYLTILAEPSTGVEVTAVDARGRSISTEAAETAFFRD